MSKCKVIAIVSVYGRFFRLYLYTGDSAPALIHLCRGAVKMADRVVREMMGL